MGSSPHPSSLALVRICSLCRHSTPRHLLLLLLLESTHHHLMHQQRRSRNTGERLRSRSTFENDKVEGGIVRSCTSHAARLLSNDRAEPASSIEPGLFLFQLPSSLAHKCFSLNPD